MDEIEIQERKIFQAAVEARLDRNELQAAIDLAEERLKQTPGDLDARIAICRAWLLQGRVDEVGEMLREIEDILAGLSQIYSCMGDICMKKGLADSADEFYRKCASLNPGKQLSSDVIERLSSLGERRAEAVAEEEEIPADFRTVTLAELYIRQGHLRQAEELLENIIGSDQQNEKAAGLLQDLRERMVKEAPGRQHAGVIAELSRWLNNVGRLHTDGA